MISIKEKIAVFGLGNVGLVCALCLANEGHDVVGIEVSEEKVNLLLDNELYIYEPGLRDIFQSAKPKLTFSTDYLVVSDVENIFICVGTPKNIDGSVNLSQVEHVCEEIGHLLKKTKRKINIYLRSTVPPKTVRNIVVKKLQEYSSKKNELDFNVFFLPEFLREGNAVEDFNNPSLTVLGSSSGEAVIQDHRCINFGSNYHIVKYEESEMIKYVNNSFHALKVSFTNEVASISKEYDVDSQKVFEMFCSDNKLNISNKYLRPGFSYGGPCLTKDLSALEYLALEKNIKSPLLDSIRKSNDAHIDRYINLIESSNFNNILFCGLSFKANTDDRRESKIIEIISSLEKRASYQKKKIHIFENMNTVKKISNEYPNSFYELDETINTMDLVVIGTYFDKKIFELASDDTTFINLGFEEYSELKDLKTIRVI